MVLAAVILGVGTAALMARAESMKASGANPAWKVTGELEESCSCDGACPCWFGNKPTKATCSGNAVVFITKGTYGKVPLDGLAIAQAVQSPEGKSMMESMGSWKFNYIYLDEKANPEQRKALEAIAGQIFPPAAAKENSKIQYTAITRKIDGKEHAVSVGSYLNFSAHLMQSPMGGAPKIVNPMIPDPIHREYSQGTTTRQTYKDAAEWDFSNSNYMYNTFTVTNKDYEELAAKMEHSGMEGMEKK